MISTDRPAALIVEHQPFAGLVASDILEESGFSTHFAFDADDALATLRAHPETQVVVTEAALSGAHDGLDLARRIAAEQPHVRLVITLGNHDIGAASLPAGAQLLQKPYASADLRRLVGAEMLEQA